MTVTGALLLSTGALVGATVLARLAGRAYLAYAKSRLARARQRYAWAQRDRVFWEAGLWDLEAVCQALMAGGYPVTQAGLEALLERRRQEHREAWARYDRLERKSRRP